MRSDFAASVVRTLWFQVGVFFLSFLLMFVLPAGAGREAATSPADMHDAAEPAVAAAG